MDNILRQAEPIKKQDILLADIRGPEAPDLRHIMSEVLGNNEEG
jgi:hypothetical protein